MSSERAKLLAARRAQRLRDKRKESCDQDIRVSLSSQEQDKLSDICQFFAYPSNTLSHTEVLQSLIHRVHAEIPLIERELGTCKKCGEQLPQGCAKLREGGLFKGDAMCWHTINRIQLMPRLRSAQND
ncbi:hypothetical protein OTK51_04390 [Vibrio scophthalmi]|uniref:hypothetical protein n=1 Tax=Vibrio scophthalmi TaxID=45658 RepID=UPI0022844C90|nr:hypothetical protein [Vibrio scophthalmi]MCY9802666.1 hypothetical protein [Vibrio scophthalmi]